MNRMTWNVLGMMGCVAVLAAAACSKDDTTSTPTGSATGTTTGSATGTTTGTATGTSTGTSSCDGCWSCGPYALACAVECPAGNPVDLLCDASFPVSQALNGCICDPERGACDQLCGATCALSGTGGAGTGGAGQGGDAEGCRACQSAAVADSSSPCYAEFGACTADIECQP